MQVADTVDDKHIHGWLHIAAKGLRKNALSSCSDDIKQDTADGLCLLSHHLRCRLLEAAAFNSVLLDRVLDLVPTAVHSTVLEAMTTRELSFQIALFPASCPALKELASLPSSPPSVLSLHVDNKRATERGQELGQEVWSCLKQVLNHHSGLTSLTLSPSPSTTISQDHLLPEIAMLTSLRALDLAGCIIHDSSSSSVTSALQALTHLCDLRLSLWEKVDTVDTEATHSQKRPRNADTDSQHCLASILSAAAALTSLHIHVCQRASPGTRARFTVAAPLHMPQLGQLTASFHSRGHGYQRPSIDIDLAERFFTMFTAALTSLTLGQGLPQRPQATRAADAAGIGRLLRSFAVFTQLRCLSAMIPEGEGNRDELIMHLHGLIAALHQLQSISVSADSTVMQHVVAMLTPTTLTKLHLGGLDSHNASNELFHRVRQCELRDLSLNFLSVPSTAPGLAALSSLTQLTALHLHGWDCLRLHGDMQVLASMTCLQALSLGGSSFDNISFPCSASLHALSALTGLTVIVFRQNTDELEFVDGLAAQPLPALRELKLTLCHPFGAVDKLARYVGELVALRRLTVELRRYSSPAYLFLNWPDDDSDDNAKMLAVWSLGVARQSLTNAAASAGVELVIEEHGFPAPDPFNIPVPFMS